MGTKLSYCYKFLFLLVLLSCTTTRKKTSSGIYVTEKDYIEAYKTSVFYGCMNEGTKGNFSKFLQQENDLGLFTQVEMIFQSNVKEAKTLGQLYSKKIVPFSYGDGAGKVPNFSKCFLYSQSPEVDSFARASYKRSLNPIPF